LLVATFQDLLDGTGVVGAVIGNRLVVRVLGFALLFRRGLILPPLAFALLLGGWPLMSVLLIVGSLVIGLSIRLLVLARIAAVAFLSLPGLWVFVNLLVRLGICLIRVTRAVGTSLSPVARRLDTALLLAVFRQLILLLLRGGRNNADSPLGGLSAI